MPSADKILIQDLLLRTVIGLTDHERRDRQDVVINLTLFADLRRAGESDSVDDSLNYRTLAKAIIAHVEPSAYYTVEALATAIARLCIEHGAERAIVRVEKPGALRFAQSVGVEIDRDRADFTP